MGQGFVRSDELKRVRACEHLVAAGHALRQADVSQAHDHRRRLSGING